MPQLTPSPKFRAVGSDGLALVGGKLWSYTEGTSTPKDTYTDFTLGSSNTNPVILDARGEADIWLSGSYKLVLTDSADVVIWTVDSIRDLTQNQTFTNATLAGTLTISSSSVTWSGNPTHSGNHTFTGNVTVNGNTQLGNASSDTLRVDPNAVTWTNNPTHSGNHTYSGNVAVTGTHSSGSQTITGTWAAGSAGTQWAIDSSNRLKNVGATQPAFSARDSSARTSAGDFASFTEVFDQGATFNPTTGVFTAPVAGLYLFSAHFFGSFSGGDATTRVSLQVDIEKNGTAASEGGWGMEMSVASVSTYVTLCIPLVLAASDTVNVSYGATGSSGTAPGSISGTCRQFSGLLLF